MCLDAHAWLESAAREQCYPHVRAAAPASPQADDESVKRIAMFRVHDIHYIGSVWTGYRHGGSELHRVES